MSFKYDHFLRFASLALTSFFILLLCGCSKNGPSLRYDDVLRPEITSDYPAVVAVYGSGICTGTRVGINAVLTAAHCVGGSKSVKIIERGLGLTAQVVDRYGDGAPQDTSDLALLKTAPQWGAEAMRVGSHVAVGNAVRLVGYGMDEKNLYLKRTGTNTVMRISNFIEIYSPILLTTLRGTLSEAGGGEGDSGGPLLKEGASGLEIVGIVHSAIPEDASFSTQFIDLTQPDKREFLKSVGTDKSLEILGIDTNVNFSAGPQV